MKHLIVIALIVVFFTSPAIAGGEEPFTPIDAQKLIDDCWAKYQAEIDTGVTARMRAGGAKANICLEGVILDQVDAMFEPDILERKEAQAKLKNLRNGLGSLYWDIYNSHKKCHNPRAGVFCGH